MCLLPSRTYKSQCDCVFVFASHSDFKIRRISWPVGFLLKVCGPPDKLMCVSFVVDDNV